MISPSRFFFTIAKHIFCSIFSKEDFYRLSAKLGLTIMLYVATGLQFQVLAKRQTDSVFMLSPAAINGDRLPVDALDKKMLSINGLKEDLSARYKIPGLSIPLQIFGRDIVYGNMMNAIDFSRCNQHETALSYLEIAELNIRPGVNVLLEADIYRIKAFLLYKTGKYQQALNNIFHAIGVYKAYSTTEIPLCYDLMSILLQEKENVRESVTYRKRAIDLLSEIISAKSRNAQSDLEDIQLKYMDFSGELANSYVKSGDYKNAIRYFKKAIYINRNGKLPGETAILLGNIAGAYFQAGANAKAKANVFKALRLSRSNELKLPEANALMYLGKFSKDKFRALAYLDTSIKILKNLGAYSLMEQALNYKALRAEYFKDVVIAVASLRESQRIRDSIWNAAQDERILGLQTTFKLSESAFKIKELEVENLKGADKNRQYLIATVLILSSSLMMLYFLLKLNHLNKKLKVYTKQLEGLNNFKNKVFFILGHDVRGALAGMSTILHILDKHGRTVEDFPDLIRHLSSLKNSALDMLEKLFIWGSTGAAVAARIGKINIPGDIYSAIDISLSLASAKNIFLDTSEFHGNFSCKGNVEHIEFIIRNLLSNAIKFSKPSSNVKITIKECAQELAISVINHGSGIDLNDMEMIFSGSLGSSKGTGGEKGAGAGLMLCKKIADMDGYRLLLERVTDGKIVFSLYLPFFTDED